MSEDKIVEPNAVVALKLWDKDAIKSDQDTIRVSLVKLDFAIHQNAVQCMLHAEKHGDTSLMRRLLVDIVDAKSGYRRQGIIAWMKTFSPMRLSGTDNINLSGMDGEVRQAFRCEEANKTPFTSLASANEVVLMKPIFKDGLTSKIERAAREYKAAIDNTQINPGSAPTPKDPKKPFYNGIHLDKMEAGFAAIEKILANELSFGDDTKTVYTARETQKQAEALLKAQAAEVGELVEEPAK